ncbi:hypothetical protein A9Q99_13070 [Gammaproteobacteria bacterium 45_16_T64]|nr:hypothetical protein A9Q99_13070 [Gammaproteobacteria bacterium 45_16_T64]
MRHQLIEKLNQSSGGELIIVSGPAGYGKTTLISQWLHTHPHTFAWLTIDQTASSPYTLWQHIINALQNVQPGLGKDALLQLSHHQPPVVESEIFEQVIISLLNDLDALCTNNNTNEPLTLVLDDFHSICGTSSNPITLHLMNLFLDHLPPSLRLVLTSRSEPSLSLPRRRANNQLLEICEQDLAFNYSEGKLFFNNTMQLSLIDSEIHTLFQRSEGWVAGLQLAALSLQKNPSLSPTSLEQGSLNKHISDYLFEEVFALQTASLQQFLITTASVPRFCAGLCNSMLDIQHGLTTISQLDQRNLFLIPLDNHGTWYRYHDLFRQFLLNQFSEQPLLEQNTKRANAAKWLEEAGYIEDALDQWMLVEDWEHCTRLLHQIIDVNDSQSSNNERIAQWLTIIPPDAQKKFNIPASPAKTGTNNPVRTIDLQDVNLLTSRETEVMHLVSQGLANKQIATELNISLNTLKVHIRNLYGKMGVENRTQALLKLSQKN